MSFVEESCVVQSEFTTYQQMHHISLSYITMGCLLPFLDRRVLVVQMKSRTKKHGHRFLQAVSLYVFEVTQAFTNKISGKKVNIREKQRAEELLVAFLNIFTQSAELSASWT